MSPGDCLLRAGLAIAGLATFLVLWACGPSASGSRERPISASISPVPSEARLSWNPSTLATARSLPPTESEVRAAIQRAFGSDVGLERDSVFLVGDFNGDESQDLVVAVNPVEAKLPEVNDALANWIIQDPRHAFIPPTNKRVIAFSETPRIQRVRSGEKLLAVIHGYAAAGWRDPMARQAYLLRGVAGEAMKLSRPSPRLLHDFGAFPTRRDVIAEILGDSPGVLYWTGATYAWHAEQ